MQMSSLNGVDFQDCDYQYEDVSSLLREYEEEFVPNHKVAIFKNAKLCNQL